MNRLRMQVTEEGPVVQTPPVLTRLETARLGLGLLVLAATTKRVKIEQRDVGWEWWA